MSTNNCQRKNTLSSMQHCLPTVACVWHEGQTERKLSSCILWCILILVTKQLNNAHSVEMYMAARQDCPTFKPTDHEFEFISMRCLYITFGHPTLGFHWPQLQSYIWLQLCYTISVSLLNICFYDSTCNLTVIPWFYSPTWPWIFGSCLHLHWGWWRS